MSQAKKQTRTTLSVRDFPVDLRDLLNRVAKHLKVGRDELIADLLSQDVGRFAETFSAIEKQMDGINQWWKSRGKTLSKKDVE